MKDDLIRMLLTSPAPLTDALTDSLGLERVVLLQAVARRRGLPGYGEAMLELLDQALASRGDELAAEVQRYEAEGRAVDELRDLLPTDVTRDVSGMGRQPYALAVADAAEAWIAGAGANAPERAAGLIEEIRRLVGEQPPALAARWARMQTETASASELA